MAYKAGYTVWKFYVEGRGVIYKNTNKDALSLFLNFEDKYGMRIYKRTGSGWVHAADWIPRDNCVCGGSYSDTINGIEFKWRNYNKWKTLEELTTLMNTPYLCQKCYYFAEWKENRWCPAFWRQRFET